MTREPSDRSKRGGSPGLTRELAAPGVDPGATRELTAPGTDPPGRLYGKYRGLVKDNKDALGLGRILPAVPRLPGMTLNWALPCVPYAGDEVGLYAIPPIGAKVWIEFEAGDPDHPLWTGCFWHRGEVPAEAQAEKDDKGTQGDPSQIKVLRTRVLTLIADDTNKKGRVQILFRDPSVSKPVKVSLELGAKGLEIACERGSDRSTLSVAPQSVAARSEKVEIQSDKGMSLTAGKNLDAKAESELKLNAKTLAAKSSGKASLQGANVLVKGSGKLDLEASRAANLKGRSVQVLGTQGSARMKGLSAEVRATLGSAKVAGTSVTVAGPSIKFSPV